MPLLLSAIIELSRMGGLVIKRSMGCPPEKLRIIMLSNMPVGRDDITQAVCLNKRGIIPIGDGRIRRISLEVNVASALLEKELTITMRPPWRGWAYECRHDCSAGGEV